MPPPEGFTFVVRASGDVVISHHGRVAATLRGRQADRFVEQSGSADAAALQARMARLTGNYRRGNERQRRPGR